MISIEIVLLVLLAYLLGSIPSAVWMGKLFAKTDVREHGSGNAGATNTFRVLGAKVAIPVLLFDVFKGWLAVHLIEFVDPKVFTETQHVGFQVLLGACAWLGHVFPVFARFKGGKGVATLLGMALALYLFPVLLSLGVFILVFSISRFVSLSSILAAVLFPVFVLLVFADKYSDPVLVYFSLLVAVIIPLTHRKNIVRLIKGEELKIDFKSAGKKK